MKLIIFIIISIIAVSQAATIVPVDSSSVNVHNSGKDYSYSIHENRGLAISTVPVIHHPIPLVKSVQHIQSVDNHGGEFISREQSQAQGDTRQQTGAQVKTATHIQELSYAVPVSPITYGYLPAGYQYGLTYSHGLPYPYNIIGTV